MKLVISNRVVLSRVPEGPIAPYLSGFADSLIATGYTAWWIHRQVLLGAGFSRWLGMKAVALQDMTLDHLTRYLQHRARHLRPRGDDRGALTHLMGFLRREGVVPEETTAVPTPSSV